MLIKSLTYILFSILILFTAKNLSNFALSESINQEVVNENHLYFNEIHEPIGDKTFSVLNNGYRFKVPYFTNVKSIDNKNELVTRAVIALHGASRNAGEYYKNMLHAAEMESTQLDTLLIIAPQFLMKTEIEKFQLDKDHLYWSSEGWKTGRLSKNRKRHPRYGKVSSFSIIDSLMTRLVKKLPNLKTIVFSGHSAGGQFVNRYAAASPIPDEIKALGITIRFIVNNPSSYLYMDSTRRHNGNKTFEVPQTDCVAYNKYKYGLKGLPRYLKTIGVNQIRTQFPEREVVYLLGEEDNDLKSSSLDTSYEGNLQGRHRLERGLIYYEYLQSYYGSNIKKKHVFGIIPDVGHSHGGMFQSALGRFYAFRK